MPKFLPEVFVSNNTIATWVFRELKKGTIRKLGSKVYTKNLIDPPEALIRRHAWFIVEALFPEAIIADRTALEHKPSEGGVIFVISKKKRPVKLPGLTIYPRSGIEPMPEDKPFMGNLFLSSPARAFLENMRLSRPKNGQIARTLSRKEIEEKLERILQSAGNNALLNLRDEARRIAPLLFLEKEFKNFDALVGTLLGIRKSQLISPVTKARLEGMPYDPKRLELFQKLYEALAGFFTETRNMKNHMSALPFFEAYFSNFIEGTEFEVQEAARIIFSGKIPKDRPADAHDIISTYRLVADPSEMQQIPKDANAFIAILKKRHSFLMHSRPEMQPGIFKTEPNQAGSTLFVDPELVEGTLRKGFQWLQALQTPFQRAVFMMFLVAEVHPFSDGNGRIGRIMMNAELVHADQARIIVPTIFRNNYLSALKALTHNRQPNALIKVLDFAQKYTASIHWEDHKNAQKVLSETHAFEDPQKADLLGIQLILPKNFANRH